MTDVFDRIRAANPVPDVDRFHESVIRAAAEPSLSSIRDRRDHMTVEEITRLESPAPEPQRRQGWPGWQIAAAAAMAAVALVAGIVLVGGGGDDTPGLDDLGLAEQFLAALAAGDVAGYEALVAPDAEAGGGPFFGPPSAQWAYVSRFQAATGGTYTAECELTPDSPTVDVRCATGEMNRFREAASLNPSRTNAVFAIDGGVITLMNFEGGSLIQQEFDQITAYDGWLQVNYPDEYAGLMGIPQWILDLEGSEDQELLPMPLVNTDAQVARHDQLTAEWLASLSQ